uniref:Craniofacial development protein 2-like n=1 Tax=Nicotiana tabacum TaxID=4097 RepID=A0A1S4A219_TOBAC|nr:PREDICTED: uncharacterized protein LOC107792979 [Nicotiana tabacum]
MTIKLVVSECTLNVVSAYAPQVGLDEEIKRRFWEGLDDIVRSIPPSERLFIGGDFNGHIRSSVVGYTEVHGGFGVGERNGGGTSLLDFAKAFDLVIANSSFPKRDEHLVTYKSAVPQKRQCYRRSVKREPGMRIAGAGVWVHLRDRRCGSMCVGARPKSGVVIAGEVVIGSGISSHKQNLLCRSGGRRYDIVTAYGETAGCPAEAIKLRFDSLIIL